MRERVVVMKSRFMPVNDFPPCSCGKKAQPMHKHTMIEGVVYNVWRPVSKRTAKILNYEEGTPLCDTCKKKASKLSKEKEGIPTDWTISEYDAFKNYIKFFPNATIEEYRTNRQSTSEECERLNYQVIQFLQFGDENKPLTDFITNSPIYKNEYNETGPLSVLNNTSRATVDLHHFVTVKNVSVMKSSLEPSQIVKAYLIENSYILLTEFMGIITLNNTTHKDVHCNMPDADINTYLDSDKAPFWAQSPKNYKQVQNRFPVLKSLSYGKALAMLTVVKL